MTESFQMVAAEVEDPVGSVFAEIAESIRLGVPLEKALTETATTEEGIHKTLVDYRTGDMWAPKLDIREALKVECEHFVECVRHHKMPQTSAASGLLVVRLLEAASASLAGDGKTITLERGFRRRTP